VRASQVGSAPCARGSGHASRRGPQLRELHLRHADARRLRRLLDAGRRELVGALRETADIPMIHVSGWYDRTRRGHRQFRGAVQDQALARTSARRSVAARSEPDSSAGDVEFGPDAAMPEFATSFHVRWFDHFLKGSRTASRRSRRSGCSSWVRGTATRKATASIMAAHG